jgi:hypothetical protein
MRQAATQIAEAGGAEVRERSMLPGAISVSRYAEPLAGTLFPSRCMSCGLASCGSAPVWRPMLSGALASPADR